MPAKISQVPGSTGKNMPTKPIIISIVLIIRYSILILSPTFNKI